MKPEISRKIFEKFPGVKQPKRSFDNPLLFSAEVKERMICTFIPPLGVIRPLQKWIAFGAKEFFSHPMSNPAPPSFLPSSYLGRN